jgi:hypothetical protein
MVKIQSALEPFGLAINPDDFGQQILVVDFAQGGWTFTGYYAVGLIWGRNCSVLNTGLITQFLPSFECSRLLKFIQLQL